MSKTIYLLQPIEEKPIFPKTSKVKNVILRRRRVSLAPLTLRLEQSDKIRKDTLITTFITGIVQQVSFCEKTINLVNDVH